MIRMPIPGRKRALEAGASFIEVELHRMRERAQLEDSQRDENGRVFPLTTSLEGDLMAAVEWASCAATLRALAEQEKP